ncbi:MAG: hypothetical protein Q4A07_09995, partial [Coriobacteriales bacterium]|nr:hypothetical protein [Coriobacteriales bacterium]
ALGLAADHKPLRGSDPVRVPKNIAFCDVLTQQGFAQRKAARETDLDSEISATRESIKSLTQAATKGGWDFKTQTFDANQWSATDIDHAKDRTAFALATLCYVEGRLAGGSSRPGLRGKKLEEAQRHGKNAISLVKGTHTATEAITLHFFALTLVCLLESMMLDSSPEREKTIVRVAKKVIKHEDNAAEILQDGDYGLRGKRTLADCWAGSSKAYETLAKCSDGASRERYLKHAVVSLKNSVELTGACYGPQHPDTLQRKVRLEKLQADLG